MVSRHGMLAAQPSRDMLRMFIDPDIDIDYVHGSTTVENVAAYLDHSETELVYDAEGRAIKVTRAGLVMSREDSPPFIGVANPSSRGVTFIVDGEEWHTRSDAGVNPIEWQTDNLTRFNVVKSEVVEEYGPGNLRT